MGAGQGASKIERYAARIDARLRKDEASTDTMRVFTDSALRRVLLDCGFKKRGSKNVARIEAALEEQGVFADPPLSTPGLHWERRIKFTRTKPVPRLDEDRERFASEYKLETFLVDNFRSLFPGLRLVKRQFEVKTGKVDILARDDSGYVVIELKNGEPDEGLVYQLMRYLKDVSEWAANHDNEASVRGLVISERADPDMHRMLVDLAAATNHFVEWMEYRVRLQLHDVPTMQGVHR